MASAKEIQNRIKSIRDTMKITKAMYMMSSMKFRKAKQMLADTEPYFYGLKNRISDILLHFPEIEHLYFDNRGEDMAEVKKRKAYIVMTGDKGMAGAFNHNILKEAERCLREDPEAKLFVVGEVGRAYFQARGKSLDPEFLYTAYNPTVHRARLIAELIMELYQQEEVDQVYVIYTRMVNTMKEEVENERILPLPTRDFITKERLEQAKQQRDLEQKNILQQPEDQWVQEDEYLIYPSPVLVIESLVTNYVTGFIYGALVESTASEENARMLAMQSATDNAQDMLHDLSVEFNRVRQAAITQEITEVIGGAKALKKKKKKMKDGERYGTKG